VRVYIADTSAWMKSRHSAVAGEWSTAILNEQIATCPIVRLELLYSARSGDAFDEIDSDLSVLRDVPITPSMTNASLAAFRRLAHAAVGVLHYDIHFDRLAEVLDFESRWVAPARSL
jgi:predicted nucleic acid-binding protein